MAAGLDAVEDYEEVDVTVRPVVAPGYRAEEKQAKGSKVLHDARHGVGNPIIQTAPTPQRLVVDDLIGEGGHCLQHPFLGGPDTGAGQADDLGPSHDQRVVGQCLLRPLPALTDDIEAISELSSRFPQTPNSQQKISRLLLAAGVKGPTQVLGNLPDSDPAVQGWIPRIRQLIPAE